MKLQRIVVLGTSLAMVLAGCARQESPTSPETQQASALAKSPATATTASEQLISGFLVAYTGRSVAGGNTTFGYSVTAPPDGPAMNQFVLQIPGCAGTLVASSPNGGTVGPDQLSGLYGIKWGDVSISNGQTQSFTVAFAGDVPEGFIRVSAKIGDTVNGTVLPGPCQAYVISGTVYVDPDSSGTRNLTQEPGIIADVTVTLVDASGNVKTALTDAAGNYQFTGFDGTYTLRIEVATAAADFNEQLYDAFWATQPTEITFSISGDSPGHDFGYKPKAKKIAADINLGVLLTTGKDRSFWTKVVRTVSRGGTYGGYDAATVLGFLAQIEAAFFPVPYQLSDGNEFGDALGILTANVRDPLAELYRELFVTELNDAAGLGLVNDPDLQDVLISWGESLIVQRSAPAKLGTGDGSTQAKTPSTDSTLTDATAVFTSLNERGGGTIPD